MNCLTCWFQTKTKSLIGKSITILRYGSITVLLVNHIENLFNQEPASCSSPKSSKILWFCWKIFFFALSGIPATLFFFFFYFVFYNKNFYVIVFIQNNIIF